MKKLISKMGLIVLTVVLLSGCGNSTSELREDLTESVNQKEESTTASDSIELTETVEAPIEKEEEAIFESTIEVLPAMDDIPAEIAEVFYDNKPFNYVFYAWPTGYDGEKIPRDSMQVCVKDFVYDAYIDVLEDGSLDIEKYSVQWKKYTVLDLDNDGSNELIYYVYPGGSGFYIIFHVIDGEVYGYSELYRDFELYKDGTIAGESGSSWYWLKEITSFDKSGYSENEFARQEDDNYTINGEEVTAVDFCDYVAKWTRDEGELAVEWFSAEGVNNYPLVNNSALKEKIIADYEEAYVYWMWFAGGAPMDGDFYKEGEDCHYYGFDYPGITTMDEFKKFLKKRFTDEIIQFKLKDEFFKEYDGKLYVMDAARGSNILIGHVEYEVYYDSDKKEGEIVALIYMQDFDEKTNELYLTGVVDKKGILFTMEDDGAVFRSFPTIW